MRSGKSLLGLFVVAAALGGYIYFVEMKREPASLSGAPAREKVFTLEAGSIERVELTNADAETTTVVRQDAEWAIIAPAPADADIVEISTLVSSIESLERTRVVVEAPESLATFGLDPARITVAFSVAGEPSRRQLHIGNRTPTGGDLYAHIEGAPAVFLIAGHLEDTFNKSAFDLREKSVLTFSRDGADALAITRGGTRVAMTKSGSDWRVSTPINAAADFSAVDGIIGRLFQARMASLVTADGTTNLRDYGLDRPQAVVTVGSGSAQAELAIGATAEDETHVYARDLSRPLVFTVEKTLLDELTKTPSDLRTKDVFGFRSFNASAFEITSSGTTYTFTKAPGEGDNATAVWTVTSPTSKVPDATKMTDLLTTTSNLRAESFAGSAFASGETVTVTVTYTDVSSPTTETVTLRKSGTVVHAIRADEPGAAIVSTTDYDRVIALLQEIAG